MKFDTTIVWFKPIMKTLVVLPALSKLVLREKIRS